jgi:hypothetical protein
MNRFQRAWQAFTDRAVSSADQQLGIAAPETSGGQAGSLEGRPATGQVQKPTERGPSTDIGLLAPERPVTPLPAAQPTTVEAIDEQGRVQIYGIPATAFPGGFISSHGEFDQKLYGWQGVKTYERMRRTSAQVDATLESVIQPIISAKWDVVAAEEADDGSRQSADGNQKPETENRHPVSSTGAGKTTEAKKKEIADAAKENLLHNLEWQDSRGNWHSQDFKTEVLRSALLEVAMGCSAVEEVYTVDGGALRLARLVDLPPVTFYQWDMDQDGRTLRNLIQFGWRRDRYERVNVPAEKICTFSYRQEGADLWGRPMLRSAYEHWYIVMGDYRIDAIAGERNGMGIPCVTSGPNPSVEDKAAARAFVTQLAAHEKTGMVLPNGWTFELVGVKGTTHDIYQSIIHHNEQISRCALNTFLDMGRGGKSGASGNRSLGESAQQFFWLCLQNEADSIASRITNKTLRRWAYYNYGPGAPVPQLRAANVVARSFQEVSDMLSTLAQGGLVVSDQEMRDEIRTQLGMPQETRDGLVAVKGETIDMGSGVEISGRSAGQVDTGAGSQGQEEVGSGQKAEGSRQPTAPAPAAPPEEKPNATASRQKLKMSDAFLVADGGPVPAIQAANTLPVNPRKLRGVPSKFWQPGDPAHLEHVYPNEAHVNFPAHWRALRKAESGIASYLRGQRDRAIRAMANQMALALIAGEKPGNVQLSPGVDLAAGLTGIIDPLYQMGRSEVRAEHERLDSARRDAHYARLQMADAGAKPQGGLFARIAAQFFDEALENDATNAGISMLKKYGDAIRDQNAGELADELFGAIDDNSDGFIDGIADQTARPAFRKGRSDEFDALAAELEKQGYKLQMIRVCAMEKDSCDSCREANGQPIDPGEDITEIHEGPPDTCECAAMESI